MGLIPGVTIVLEGTGDVLMKTPGFHSLPREADVLHLSSDGGPDTLYKVEKVDIYLESATHLNTPGQTTHVSVATTCIITVSLVP